MHGLLTAAVGAVFLVATLGLPKATPAEREVRADIDAFGSASFLVAQGGDWRQSWVVSCSSPLRDCVARSFGAVLRLDPAGQPWLLVSTGQGATLLLRDAADPATAEDITAILSRPITPSEVAELSRPDAALVLVTRNGAELALNMQGTAHVVDYLQWLASPTARGLRDARQWTSDGVVDPEKLDPIQLERFRVMKLRDAGFTSQMASL